MKNGTISFVKEGKNTFIETSELIRVFPDIKLNVNISSVNSLQSLTIELIHKDEIIRMLNQQLSDKQKDNEFLKTQLTQVNNLLQDKTLTKRKKFFWIF